MNILEHYIKEVYSVEDVTGEMEQHSIPSNGERWLRVRMRINCYGANSDVEQIFRESEWEEAKKKGYFMG